MNQKNLFKEQKILHTKIDYATTKEYHSKQIDTENFSDDILVPITKDAMFKTMFACTKRKKYLCRLLSYVLNFDELKIYDNFEYINIELDREFLSQKGERVDLVGCLFGILINVEVNRTPLLNRNIKYLERISREEITIKSKTNTNQIEAIQININDVSYEGDKTVDYFWMGDIKGRAIDNKVLVNISIPIIRKKMYTKGEESLEGMERYIAMTTTTNKKKAEKIAGDDKLMKEYIKEAKQVEKNTIPYYPDLEVDYRDYEWFYRKLAKMELIDQGREEGRKEARLEKMSSAKSVIAEGVSLDIIKRCLNLSDNDIQSIKN